MENGRSVWKHALLRDRRRSLGLMRGLNQDVPASAILAPLHSAPSARAAAVSLRSRTKPRRSGAGGSDPGFLRPHPRDQRRHGAGDLPERMK